MLSIDYDLITHTHTHAHQSPNFLSLFKLITKFRQQKSAMNECWSLSEIDQFVVVVVVTNKSISCDDQFFFLFIINKSILFENQGSEMSTTQQQQQQRQRQRQQEMCNEWIFNATICNKFFFLK